MFFYQYSAKLARSALIQQSIQARSTTEMLIHLNFTLFINEKPIRSPALLKKIVDFFTITRLFHAKWAHLDCKKQCHREISTLKITLFP